jgi:hypothetical protein
MRLKTLLLFVGILQAISSFAQQDWKGDYARAKQVYQLQKYEIAMEYFLPVTSPDASNAYASYAQYYYSLAAFRAGKYNEARQMLLQLINRDPNWKQIDEAEYLLAAVYFELKQYRFGMTSLASVNGMESSVTTLKQSYFPKVNPIDTLIQLQRIYSSDKEIAKALFNKLVPYPKNSKNNMLYEYLAQEFKFAKQSNIAYVTKNEYHVAVIFPFNLTENIAERSRNNYVDEIYQGILIAIDSLKKSGTTVIVHGYDVDRDVIKVQTIISYPEMKSMDLIIGPLYSALIPYVTTFGEQNNIPVINPISLNSNIIENTTKTLLFQPTLESIAGEVSDFAKREFVYRKNVFKDSDEKAKTDVVIFYSTELKDSLLASYYKDSLLTKGFTISKFVKITKLNIATVGKIFSDSLSLLKTSHIFVASGDPALASNIISAVEISRQNIPIVTKSEWLDINNQTYEQFERRKVYFIYPDFVNFTNSSYKLFRSAYVKRNNSYPSKYSILGYELMSLVGVNMKQTGTGFLNQIRTTTLQKGHFMSGYDYSKGAYNSYVPIYYFSDLKLTLANPIE